MASEFWTREILEGSVRTSALRFLAWYRREFFSLFPPETAAWLTDRGDRQLILRAGDPDLWCIDARGGRLWRLSGEELASSTLEEALRTRGLARNAVRIGLEIESDAFFVRRFDVPSAAAASLPKLLVADIERKTPFRLAEVLYGHTAAKHPGNPDKLRVTLWILRRDIAESAVERAGLAFSDIAFVRPADPRGGAQTPLITLAAKSETSHLFRNLALGLCAAAAGFFIIGVAATLWRQNALAEELDGKIQEMSARAARVRQVVDRASSESRLLSVLRIARRNGPQFADLWEETARILPDSAYVTDFRLSEPKPNEHAVDIAGFASSAVGLPALFNKSPLFSDAGLTAPITPDPKEKREGFSLQAKLEHRKPEGGK
ncbi:MAG: fimbrial assembly protein [Hyphomicrobiales bacterium]|nr:MAG: fimbrial assembly protein [Hyphomicrobiales bacterium]